MSYDANRDLGKWARLLDLLVQKKVITQEESISIALARFDDYRK